jgi:uncharacterized iron-regulated membrane protein
LVLGLPIALIAASGAAVDYWFEVDVLAAPAFYLSRHDGPALPLDRVADAAHRAVPGGQIDRLFLNQDGRIAIASLTGPWGDRLRDVAIDRTSGEVLGQRWQDEAFINRLYAFHTSMLLGDGAKPLILLLAILFVGLLVSGVALWWPSPQHWRAALSWRLTQRAKLLDLHAKAGLYGSALTAIAGVTAVILLWPDAGSPPCGGGGAHVEGLGTSLQSLVDAVREPGWQPVNILRPDDTARPLRIILWRPAGLLRSEAIKMVAVGRDAEAITHLPLGDRHVTARAFHNGRIGGEAGRFAMALAALLPLLLWVTGFAHWLRKRGWPQRDSTK